MHAELPLFTIQVSFGAVGGKGVVGGANVGTTVVGATVVVTVGACVVVFGSSVVAFAVLAVGLVGGVFVVDVVVSLLLDWAPIPATNSETANTNTNAAILNSIFVRNIKVEHELRNKNVSIDTQFIA
jgi:hypothetical protein